MKTYASILAALDLSEGSPQVFERALLLAGIYQARLSLIHVVESPAEIYGLDLPLDLGQVHHHFGQQAQELLADMVRESPVPIEAIHVASGHPSTEIARFAGEQANDLVVLGSHGRQGVRRWLGSTTNAVLHEVPCDVLVVRIRENEGPADSPR